LLNCWLVGSERDLPLEVGFHSCDEGWLGAASSSQGPTPGVTGEAPQSLQRASSTQGGEKEREAALAGAWEASRKATEEAMQLRARTMLVEEAASKAREEAIFYKDAAADLDKEKGLIKADIASTREAFQEMKVECVKGEIARSATEETKKKAQEYLEAERTRSRGLSDEDDRLKRELLEKEGAIAQAGKVIEDLRVTNTDC